MEKDPVPLGTRTLATSLRTGPSQPSMWDVAEEAALTPLTGRVVRHHLTRGAWVDHLPGWIEGSDAVLEVLLGDIGWRADRRQMYEREVAVPRLLRWYGGDEAPPHPVDNEGRGGMEAHHRAEVGEAVVRGGTGLYRGGGGRSAWHRGSRGCARGA